MTEIDKKNLKNYLCFTFGITYIAWGILAIFTPVSYTHLDVYKRQDQGSNQTLYGI